LHEAPRLRRSLSWRSGALLVAAGFALSRLAIARAGVRFVDIPLNDAFQLLDRGSLRDDLFTSLAHLHIQPPLFNLFVGLGLHAPQSWETALFRAAYLGMGLGLALGLYAVLTRLGVPARVAVVLTLVFSISPSVFLYENWLHYDLPVTLLLVLAVLALQRYEDGHRPRDAVVFFTILAAVVLTRSLFHMVWLAGWVVVLVLHRRRADWRRVAIAAAIPLVAVVGVYANILRVAGSFSSSTTLGVSLAKMTTFQLPEEQRQELVSRGELSPMALVEPMSRLESYRGVISTRPPTGVAVLDDEVKGIYTDPPTNEAFRHNMNNLSFVDVSNLYIEDALRTVRMRPRAYVQAVATAYDVFFRPASDFFTLQDNRPQVAGLDRLYNMALYGVVGGGEPSVGLPEARVQYRQAPGRTAWFVVVGYAVALSGGAWGIWRRRRAGGRGPSPLVLGFLWSTVVWVMVLGNAFEVGENNRFRLYSEPLVIALLAALAVMWRSRPPIEGAPPDVEIDRPRPATVGDLRPRKR
jgi:hypothetical protein